MEDPEIMKYKDWLNMQDGLARNIDPKIPIAHADREYTIMGKITGSRIINTKKDQQIAFLQLEDYWGSLELVVFPKIWEQESKYLSKDAIMGFSGKIDNSRKESKFLVDEVILPEQIRRFENSMVHKKIGKKNSTKS